ncbi:MAG: CDP-diacylglycerol--glycerol-3-phosphate 3-phosphatidyltransferase [bacterium]|nr:CDP-diacylglycerol--glycerol-3-phosphate 3-phosphatidyltransferase [bacterium]
MRLNLPNTITLFRIFLVPLLVVVLLTPPSASVRVKEAVDGMTSFEWFGHFVAWVSEWRVTIAVAIFLTAAASDFLDGYLARRRNEVTTLGTLLDPVADKLLTVSAFISLVELEQAPAWMIVLIVGREFAVSAMRSVAASRGQVISASTWGKSKTFSQVVAITLLIVSTRLSSWQVYGKAALWVVMVLAIYSMIQYLVQFLRTVDLGAET